MEDGLVRFSHRVRFVYILAHTHCGGVVWAETTFQISTRGRNQIALIFVSALQVKISQIRRRCVWARNYVGHYHHHKDSFRMIGWMKAANLRFLLLGRSFLVSLMSNLLASESAVHVRVVYNDGER